MSLFHVKAFENETCPEEEDYWLEVLDSYKPTDACFKCGRPLTDDLLVTVDGCDKLNDPSGVFNGPQIWMHVDCAHDLAMDLLEDYLTVKRERDRKELRAKYGLPPEDDAKP